MTLYGNTSVYVDAALICILSCDRCSIWLRGIGKVKLYVQIKVMYLGPPEASLFAQDQQSCDESMLYNISYISYIIFYKFYHGITIYKHPWFQWTKRDPWVLLASQIRNWNCILHEAHNGNSMILEFPRRGILVLILLTIRIRRHFYW